ncbi:LiaF transmembrane domain-containing protein [Levilactobacillus zymae]|uniref:LiaF transmembrane domain-containing protein n=1 Tax=Levilactobacillus zymae TaxID=267363 RepID=UPI0028B50A0D|nr:hypothetical protein [Levilactobacillus zymae]MDT6980118.1 hypothetical protein [Levilactobacillus zymae]
MRTSRRWFWGSFFIVGAVVLVLSQLGILPYQFGFWRILFAIFLVAIVVFSLAHRGITGTVFGLAALAILFAKPLGITALGPWTILGVALLVTIGLSLILNPHHYFNYHYQYHQQSSWHHGRQTTERMTTDEAQTRVSVNMGSGIRYLQSQDFQRADVWVRMGDAKLYFDDVRLNPAGAVINLDVSLGGAELYLPRTWPVKIAVDSSLGGVEEKGSHTPGDGPTVVIQGRISLSGLTVIYV